MKMSLLAGLLVIVTVGCTRPELRGTQQAVPASARIITGYDAATSWKDLKFEPWRRVTDDLHTYVQLVFSYEQACVVDGVEFASVAVGDRYVCKTGWRLARPRTSSGDHVRGYQIPLSGRPK